MGTEEAQQALVKYDVRSLPFVQLVATRRNATASSPPLLLFLLVLLRLFLLLFLLIFVASTTCTAMQSRTMYWTPFVVDRSTRSIRSKGLRKALLVGPIKMLRLTAATEKRSESYENAKRRSLRSDTEDLLIFVRV